MIQSKTPITLSTAIIAVVSLSCGGPSTPSSMTPELPGSGGISDGTTGSATLASESFRATAPPAASPRDFRLPTPQTFSLGGGIEVFLVENHDLPTVSATLVFDGGSMTDPKGKEGLAQVCMDMLTEGTRKLDKIAFKRSLADIGSSVSSWASVDTQGIRVASLKKNLEASLRLFRDSLRTPGFRATDLRRMTERRIQSIKQRKASPGSIAARLLGSVTYGSTHPRGRVSTEASTARLRISDCRGYHRRFVKPEGARLFVVGDLTRPEVEKHFGNAFKGWRGKAKALAMPSREPRTGRIFFIDVPGAQQSSVYFSHAGPMRKDDEYFANTMMTQILGGSFASRINMNLREDKGYSYGARASISYNRDAGTFNAYSSVRSDSTVQSIREIASEIRAFASGQQPAREPELVRERNGAILALPARFATSAGALGQYRSLVYYGLPLDYYNRYVEALAKIDLDAVNASAAKRLDVSGWRLLVVGDGKAPMKIRTDGGTDEPMVDRDGSPIGLRQALEIMAATKELGDGALVLLDSDGNVQAR